MVVVKGLSTFVIYSAQSCLYHAEINVVKNETKLIEDVVVNVY